jgi:hypothetical protein
MLMIGIDPGVTTGVAAWDGQALQSVTSMSICEAMMYVQALHQAKRLHSVTFEDARLRTWYGDKGREALQGAGSIKRDCQIWAEWLGMLGCPYKAISPQAKGAKVDAAAFARLTGWTARTNNHARDAAMLVFGRKLGTTGSVMDGKTPGLDRANHYG